MLPSETSSLETARSSSSPHWAFEASCEDSLESLASLPVPNERGFQEQKDDFSSRISSIGEVKPCREDSNRINTGMVTQEEFYNEQIPQMTVRLARQIAQMEVVNPEVLRVTAASRAFDRCAAALRGDTGDFYYKSRKSQKIATFWSHSGHGGHWRKILTLLIFYNGLAAVCLALLAGVLMMLLFRFETLPGIDLGFQDANADPLLFSTWSLCSGFLVAILVLILWQPRTAVFFDRICISKTDKKLKAEAIFSLAALLKKSDTMLILWDPTWTTRLWCLFELAAFLKCKTQRQALIVRPIVLGPVSIFIFFQVFASHIPVTTVPVEYEAQIGLPLGLAAGWFVVSWIRNYFRDLDIMKEQLLSISFDSTRSACCDANHVTSCGERISCDRKLLKECVNIWFGSQKAFEDTVRSEVLEILNHDLTQQVFGTAWVLGVSSPGMLAFMDRFASLPDGGWDFLEHPAAALFLEGLIFWLLAYPAFLNMLILSCRLSRGKPKILSLELLKNASVMFFQWVPISIVQVVYRITRGVSDNAMHQALAFGGSVLCFLVCNYLVALGLKALLKRPGW